MNRGPQSDVRVRLIAAFVALAAGAVAVIVAVELLRATL
jgi:hypothetical protein